MIVDEICDIDADVQGALLPCCLYPQSLTQKDIFHSWFNAGLDKSLPHHFFSESHSCCPRHLRTELHSRLLVICQQAPYISS